MEKNTQERGFNKSLRETALEMEDKTETNPR